MDTANREVAIRPGGRPWLRLLCACCFLALLIGCSSTPGDPLEKFNRAMYKFNSDLDRGIIKPAADAYVKVIPAPVRKSVGNGFSNLCYLDVIINDFLQAKWGQGLSDTGRMAVNTTVGILGIFDVATKWGMPVHDNHLGTTLGKWGVPRGPYLVIPVLGPSSARDAPDIGMQIVTNPLYWLHVKWYITVPLGALGAVDARSRMDFMVRFRSQTALDPYVFTRDAYIQYREAQVRGEKAPRSPDMYDEEMGPTSQPASPTSAPTTTPAGEVAIGQR